MLNSIMIKQDKFTNFMVWSFGLKYFILFILKYDVQLLIYTLTSTMVKLVPIWSLAMDG